MTCPPIKKVKTSQSKMTLAQIRVEIARRIELYKKLKLGEKK